MLGSQWLGGREADIEGTVRVYNLSLPCVVIVLWLNVPVNNFSFMSGRSKIFLDKQHPVLSRSKCANTTISFETTECVLEQDTLFALHCTG